MANLHLHYVFDLWVHRWRQTQAQGDVVVVRFADDFIVGFQYRLHMQPVTCLLHPGPAGVSPPKGTIHTISFLVLFCYL